MSQFIKELPHQPEAPLSIERDMTLGGEIIIIEGVSYDADYFRTFSHPNINILYSVVRDERGVVVLTCIRTLEEAKQFFENQQRASAEEESHAL